MKIGDVIECVVFIKSSSLNDEYKVGDKAIITLDNYGIYNNLYAIKKIGSNCISIFTSIRIESRFKIFNIDRKSRIENLQL